MFCGWKPCVNSSLVASNTVIPLFSSQPHIWRAVSSRYARSTIPHAGGVLQRTEPIDVGIPEGVIDSEAYMIIALVVEAARFSRVTGLSDWSVDNASCFLSMPCCVSESTRVIRDGEAGEDFDRCNQRDGCEESSKVSEPSWLAPPLAAYTLVTPRRCNSQMPYWNWYLNAAGRP